MAVPLRNMNGEVGEHLTHLHACTLATYSAAGTQTPAVGDIVIPNSTGNWYVALAGDGATGRLGRVTKIELAPVSTDLGYVVVEWFDILSIVEVDCDDASTATLLNSAIKDGDTTVENNFDAGATTGPLVVLSKSATSGACKLYCGVSWAS